MSRGPATLLGEGHEVAARREALPGAVQHAGQAGMPEHDVEKLRQMVLVHYFHAFRRALAGYSPAFLEPMRVTLTPGANLSRVKAKPRNYSPEKLRRWVSR